MTRRSRILLIVLVLGAVGVLGVLARQQAFRSPPTPGPDAGVAVQVQLPERDTAWVVLPYRGTLEGDRDASLSFRMGGEVARIHVREGAQVEVGTLLAELEASELNAALNRVRSELERARAQELHWEGEREVDERLFQVGAVSRTQLDATRLSYRSAVSAREGAEAAVAEVGARIDGTRLHAPHPGTVSRIEVTPGEGVAPGFPVLTLSGGERRIRLEVLERDLARGVQVGIPVQISAPGCEDGAGRVTLVDGAARPPFGAIRVDVTPDDPCFHRLPSGASAEVSLRLEGEADAWFVPLSALDFRGGTPRIFRIGAEGIAEAVPVRLGEQRGDLQEVRGDLEPEDRVVVRGATNLRPGDRVRIVDGAGEEGS